MKYIKTNWDVPYYNFALEEYLLHEAPPDDYFFFYVHKPSIIIGKHQNAIEEINKAYVDEQGIVVARRISGGGAVYHDQGNLNFSFIQNAVVDDMHDFEKFTRPIIEALNKLGISAELSGRNDILIDGKKISGNAQYFKNNRILSHGTLLYDVDMQALSNALNVKPMKIKSKGIKSVSSRVTNISDHMENQMTMDRFYTFLFNALIESSEAEEYVLDEKIRNWIEQKAQYKYASWDWVWGNAPDFEIQKTNHFTCGIVDVRLNVKEGFIQACKIYGDFFSKKEIEELETILIGLPYEKKYIQPVIQKVDISDYFNDIDPISFTDFLTSQ